MKLIILAGGQRSTISNEKEGIPKPMAEIGGRPILWHIMKYFSAYGIREFIICGGYKVNILKEYFMNYYIYQSDITVNLENNTIDIHKKNTEDWQVSVIDTGIFASTAQRVARVQNFIGEEEFLVTYGDCLSDVSVTDLMKSHQENGKIATLVAARPSGRNQVLSLSEDGEMKQGAVESDTNAWTSANIYAFSSRIFHYLQGGYELDYFMKGILTEQKQVSIFRHSGFWQPVETKRDQVSMESMWNAGIAPWKKWQD